MSLNDANSGRRDHLAVVLCTIGRSPSAARAIDSILAMQPAPGLVVIVHQADSYSSVEFRKFDGLPGLVRIPDTGIGVARARNIGMAAAEAGGASRVAFTDDDCAVCPGWLDGLDSAFEQAPDVALVFGTTKTAEHDAAQGTIPSYTVSRKTIRRGLASKPLLEGMGACMAVRVDAWRKIGGFDDHLGVGTPLVSAEENDLSIRLLRAGFAVAETPAAEVIHHGFRPRADIAGLIAGYMLGSGAATAKMVRIGGLPALRALATIARRWIGGRSGVEIQHLPSRSIRLWNFARGMRAGFTLQIDPATGRFLPFEEPRITLKNGPGGNCSHPTTDLAPSPASQEIVRKPD